MYLKETALEYVVCSRTCLLSLGIGTVYFDMTHRVSTFTWHEELSGTKYVYFIKV